MLGMGKTQSSGVAPSAPYSVNLNPGSVNVFSDNGSNTSPRIYSTVISGVGPFTYLWTITGSNIIIGSSTNDSTTFNASGFNTIYEEVATLTVTDTGAGNAETTRNINIKFEFENIGN